MTIANPHQTRGHQALENTIYARQVGRRYTVQRITLQQLEDYEDGRLALEALQRSDFIPLEEVKRNLGI